MTTLPLIGAIYFLVAGGPFGLEDIVSKSGYAGAIVILLLTPLFWSLPTALMAAELSSAIPKQGGYYVWVKRGMGRFWGFQEAWLSLVGGAFDVAVYPSLCVSYLGHLLPAVTAGNRAAWIAAALVVAAAAWNLMGAKSVGESSVVLASVLLAPFAVLALYCLFIRTPATGAQIPLKHVDVLGGILFAVWNYMGFDYVSTVADEVDDPQRTFPRAMAWSVILVACTYILPIALVSLTGLDANRWSTGGWADVARAIIPGPLTATVVAIAITCGGILGGWGGLNAQTMQYSRLPAVLADDGLSPDFLRRRLPSTGAPWVALLVLAAIWICCLSLSIIKLLLLDVLLTGLSLILEFAALVALRIREPELPRPYRVPGGVFGAVAVGIPPLVLLILSAARASGESVGSVPALAIGAALVGAGVPAYYLADRFCRRAARARVV